MMFEFKKMFIFSVFLKVINLFMLLLLYFMEVDFYMVNSLSGLSNNFIVCSSIVFLVLSIITMLMAKDVLLKGVVPK
jgi:hypothetical protein